MGKSPIQPLRVVVVDDNRDYTDSVAALLRFKGHEVLVAYRAQDGLALAQRVHPHIVLHDIGFDDMSGYEVARRLRMDPSFDQTLLVAVTGLDDAMASVSSAAAGFDRHVTKPIAYKCMLELLALANARRNRAHGAQRIAESTVKLAGAA